MRILFLTSLPEDCASTRQRVYKYIPLFEREGLKCKVYSAVPLKYYKRWHGSKRFLDRLLYILYETFNRISHIFISLRFDIVYIQKNLTQTSLRGMDRLLFFFNKKVIYDFDDCIYLEPDIQLPQPWTFLQDYEQINRLIKKSKAVIAGNNFLKNYAIKFNDFVEMIPTSMDTEMYRVKIHLKHSPVISIGWSGSNGTNFYVNDLINVLNALGRRYGNIKFLIISNSTSNIKLREIKNIEVVFCPWRLETLIEDLHKIDIGVMPLIYDKWSVGKCGGKLLQYMACGIPSVCSPIGANRYIIKEGINGFLANSEEEWIEKLSYLIEDAELRAKIGREGRRTIEESYSNKVNAPKLTEIFKKVFEER